MTNYIALLRGINVGGHKKFPKADQLKMIKTLGFDEPQVYIHTGNWMFQSTKKGDEVARLIESKITKDCGWEVPVIVLSLVEVQAILDNCPFSEEKREKSYFILLQEHPSKENVEMTTLLSSENEEFCITKNCVYIYYAVGAGKAKMGNNFFEKKLKVNATARNYRTMAKLIDAVTSS